MASPFGETLQKGARTMPALVLTAAGWTLLREFGPLYTGDDLNILPAIGAGAMGLGGIVLTANGLDAMGRGFQWLKARRPTGSKGTAAWVENLRELRGDLTGRESGPYWGAFKGKPVMADFASNALTLGPAGVGKGVSVAQPTILANFHSKTVVDFKGELTCVLAPALRKRGEDVKVINLGGVFEDIVGQSDCYNPLDLVGDDFKTRGGLRDVADTMKEMTLQLSPDTSEKSGSSNAKFFESGERDLLGFAILTVTMIEGGRANLGLAALLLSDREKLLNHALWACGKLKRVDANGVEGTDTMPVADSPWAARHARDDLDAFIAWYQGLASGIATLLGNDDSRAAESFLTGAQQALSSFNITSRAAKVMGRSTFRFADQKEGDLATTVFLVADASKINAQKKPLALLQWCMLQEWKRHENKHRPCHLIADEATNFKIHDLPSLMTWGRGYGIRIHLFVQSLAAFKAVYGQAALDTLLSETEIKQFLPGQKEPDTLELIKKMLGEKSVIMEGHRGASGKAFGVEGFDMREDARPLMMADEIRTMKHGILVIRGNKPLKVDLPSIAAIRPYRDLISINPFHGKPYRMSVRLHIRRRAPVIAK